MEKCFVFAMYVVPSMVECDKDKCYFMAKNTDSGITAIENKTNKKKYCSAIVLLLHGIGGIIIINHSESVSLFELANRFCINAHTRDTLRHNKMEINFGLRKHEHHRFV